MLNNLLGALVVADAIGKNRRIDGHRNIINNNIDTSKIEKNIETINNRLSNIEEEKSFEDHIKKISYIKENFKEVFSEIEDACFDDNCLYDVWEEVYIRCILGYTKNMIECICEEFEIEICKDSLKIPIVEDLGFIDKRFSNIKIIKEIIHTNINNIIEWNEKTIKTNLKTVVLHDDVDYEKAYNFYKKSVCEDVAIEDILCITTSDKYVEIQTKSGTVVKPISEYDKYVSMFLSLHRNYK